MAVNELAVECLDFEATPEQRIAHRKGIIGNSDTKHHCADETNAEAYAGVLVCMSCEKHPRSS